MGDRHGNGKMADMTVEYVRYRVQEAEMHGFMLGLAHVLKQLDTMPHCLGYELTMSIDGPEMLVLRIEWTKGPGRHRFRESPFFPGIITNGRPFERFITDMHRFRLTGISKWK